MNAALQHFILATAGHIDHGKSALVQALTGVDPDRLPEEKARGITIDLGFAHLDLSPPGEPERAFSVGIVDVPGHEDFVKNMVAGVGSVDAALLIVAADDGWMPQTEEHLQILQYLGVRRGVVALTKIDLPDADPDLALADLQDRLENSAFADVPIVPVSAKSGAGIQALKDALIRTFEATPPAPDHGKPRLPIDRLFTLKGVGTIVTGTLAGGAFSRGDAAIAQPAGIKCRIRSIQTHNRETDRCVPGSRAALNVPELRVGDAGTNEAARGHVITLPDFGEPSSALDALLEKTARLKGQAGAASRPLKNGARIRVHLGSGHFQARLFMLETDPLEPGQRRVAQIRFERPVFAFVGDRFVVRDASERWTLAGGIVLDADAASAVFRTERQTAFLKARAEAPTDLPTLVRSLVARDSAILEDRILVKSRFSAKSIGEAVASLVNDGGAFQRGEWILDAEYWRRTIASAAARVRAEHKSQPHRAGLDLAALRESLRFDPAHNALFDLLTRELEQSGFVKSGAVIADAAHRPQLAGPLEAAGRKLLAVLRAKPLDPPSRKELAPDPAARQALQFLIESGQAIELGAEVVVASEQYRAMREKVVQTLDGSPGGTVSELRQALGASRRIVVPLLERLDREGLTKRVGDRRALARP